MPLHKSTLVFGIALLTLGAASLRAEDEAEVAADGPWISSLDWSSDIEVVGTESQGLLLRPAKVFRADVEHPEKLNYVGESETSLWATLALEGGKILASDYKGGLHVFSESPASKFDAEARWIRALTPAGQDQILAGTEDGKLLVLSINEQKETKRVDAHDAAIFDIAIDGRGGMVATAGGDGKIKLFSWPELEPVGEMSRGQEAIWSVAFSASGSRLISGGADRRIQLWDVKAQESICTITRTPDWVTDLQLLPDSSVVVAGCMNGDVVVADFQSMRKVTTQSVAESGLWAVALSPDSSNLALGTRKHGLQVIAVPKWVEEAKAVSAEFAKQRPPSPKSQLQ